MSQQIIAMQSKLAFWFCRFGKPIWRCPTGKWYGLWRAVFQVSVWGLPATAGTAHEYITAEVTPSTRVRPSQRLQSSCSCKETGWERRWSSYRALWAWQGPSSKHEPAQVQGGVDIVRPEKLLPSQVQQQIYRERAEMRSRLQGLFLNEHL